MNAFFIGIITFTLIWNPCTALSQTLSKPLPSVASTSISTKTGEVIGASGRIGSFLLGSDVNHVPVPRNEDSRPGSFTEEGCPIYVAIPATQIPNERRKDLVFVTNGIPSNFLDGLDDSDERTITTSVPYFGVLSVGGPVISGNSSPKTIIHDGRHAQTLANLLESQGIRCKIEGSRTAANGIKDIDMAAIQKLIWVSSMWLFCHDSEEEDAAALTCSEVHDFKNAQLKELLRELVPAANELLEVYHPGSSTGIGSIDEVAKHLENYSNSIPTVVVSKHLSIEEFEQRNGYLLSVERLAPQPIHREIVERVVGYIPDYELDHNNNVPR